MNYKKIITIPVVVVLGLLFIIRSVLNYNGYCFSQSRYINEQEKIDTVVMGLLGRPARFKVIKEDNNPKITQVDTNNVIPYETLENFYKHNPDCCRTSDRVRLYEPNIWDRIDGSISLFVIINYKERYIDSNGALTYRSKGLYRKISNCGVPSSEFH